jgi:hypothetical protein
MGLPLGSIGPMRLRALGMLRRELERQSRVRALDEVTSWKAMNVTRLAS